LGLSFLSLEIERQERKIKRNYIYLTGGLGNQLFQLTALVALSGKRELVVDSVNGSPRANYSGVPDSYEFDLLTTSLSHHSSAFPRLIKRAIGYCLRSKIQPAKFETVLQLPSIAQLITSVMISLSLKELVWVKVCHGVGFDNKIRESHVNTFFIGYFQSYKWLEMAESKNDLAFKLSNPSELVKSFSALALIENPLVVHVRLGDYLVEGGFGTLDPSYYLKAITKAMELGDFGKIWMFSDEPLEAIKRLPDHLGLEVRVMPPFEESPATALEVMRMGRGYVIANSTFSWWSASLSYQPDPVVIYPYPWFKSIDSPLDLVPPNWLPISTLSMGT
jgi:hypothetical protein